MAKYFLTLWQTLFRLRILQEPGVAMKKEVNTIRKYASLSIVKEKGAKNPKSEEETQNDPPDARTVFVMTEKNYKKRKKSVGFGDAPKIKTLSQAKKDLIANGPTIGDFIQNGLSEPLSISEPPQNIKRKKGERLPLPPWLRTKIPVGLNYHKVKTELQELKLNTVCAEAKCPHIGECWGGPQPTATIMLMVDQCTRGCRFCSVRTARNPSPLDKMEPQNTAEAIASWGLDYVVLTSVDRDDLPDGGSNHFAETVREIKRRKPSLNVECLTPDFQGNHDLVKIVAESGLDIYAHNVEAIRRMQMVRDPRAGYKQSLGVLEFVKRNFPHMITKTSTMVGWGEIDDEIRQTMEDCRDVGIDCITIGQYMQPTKRHINIKEYVHPEKFKQREEMGKELGFLFVASEPLVRSSFKEDLSYGGSNNSAESVLEKKSKQKQENKRPNNEKRRWRFQVKFDAKMSRTGNTGRKGNWLDWALSFLRVLIIFAILYSKLQTELFHPPAEKKETSNVKVPPEELHPPAKTETSNVLHPETTFN